jgi:hypothetical protein
VNTLSQAASPPLKLSTTSAVPLPSRSGVPVMVGASVLPKSSSTVPPAANSTCSCTCSLTMLTS